MDFILYPISKLAKKDLCDFQFLIEATTLNSIQESKLHVELEVLHTKATQLNHWISKKSTMSMKTTYVST